MDDQQTRDEARRLLLALCRSEAEDLQPLPAAGHLVTLEVWRAPTRDGAEPLLTERFLAGEQGLAPLDEAAYGEQVGPDGPAPGVFLHTFRVSPGWGEWTRLEQDEDGEWWEVECDLADEPERAWLVRHSFGGLWRGRPMFNGVAHWVHLEGDEVVVDESDLWFM